jgi:hypothetical protein
MSRPILKLSLILTLFSTSYLFGQGSQIEFGKNRVQYNDHFQEWLEYESVNFITYFYGEGRNIAHSVIQFAELDHDEIQNILEHRMNDKIEIIVYTDLTDLKQSNIGSEEAFINTGGQTKIVGNKVFVYFNGDHNNLRQQVREGIAEVYMNAMLFGSNLQEIVQNAVMMNLPAWFKSGLVSFVGRTWDSELDNQLRDVILQEKYKDFNSFAEVNPKLAGHSMWYFISQNYGQSTVSNLLYLTRINRSIDSGFLYVLGTSYKRTSANWLEYFNQRYKAETSQMEKPDGKQVTLKNKRNLPLSQVKISPDGKQIVYVANEIGKYKVYLQNIKTGERKVIHKDGFRNALQATDYEYPLLAWNPNNMEVAVIYEKRDIIKLLIYDIHSKEKVVEDLDPQYQRVYSMDYINPGQMVLSATVRGFSDIFLYYPTTRQSQRITNDFYDDLDATFVKIRNKKGILFSSNRDDVMVEKLRMDTILPLNNFDLFYYDLENKSTELVRITNTPYANERQAVAVDSTWFSFLSDQSGINNRQFGFLEDYIAYYEQIISLNDGTEIILHQDSSLVNLDSTLIDSIIIQPVIKQRAINHNASNYNRNVISQHTSPKTGKLVQSFINENRYVFYIDQINPDTVITPKLTRFQEQQFIFSDDNIIGQQKTKNSTPKTNIVTLVDEEPTDVSNIPLTEKDTGEIDIDNYLFQSEFDNEETVPQVNVEEENGSISIQFPSDSPSEAVDYTTSSVPFESKIVRFNPSRITPYRLKFRTDFVTTQLDNSLLFGGLDSYAGTRQEYSYPPPGILLKANFKDLFEDYQFEMGLRIPTTFNGAEYFLLFDDKKKRLDKRYALYRRNLSFTLDENNPIIPQRSKETVFLGQMQVSYPLDIFRSFRATSTLRFDKSFLLATDQNALNTPTYNQQRLGLKIEYVFDNTLDVAINIKHGTRYKIYAEVIKRFQLDLLDDVSFDFGKGFMTVIGFDARHYQRLDKHSILAVRAAGASSFGSEKILYFLGGVDNWLFQSFNNDIPFPGQGEFAFQTLASNLRGFRYNIRNGNNFALINTELRVPIFKYISNNIRSSFVRNFQVVGFFDIGTAWQGFSPFNRDSPLNTIYLYNPPTVSIKVNYFRDPIVAGYGVGIRTMLFGYFIRLDYARGIETRVVQDPRLYFSMGMDF